MGEKKIMSSNSEEKDLLFYEAYEDFYDMLINPRLLVIFVKRHMEKIFPRMALVISVRLI